MRIWEWLKKFVWQHMLFVLAFVGVTIAAVFFILLRKDAGPLFTALFKYFGHDSDPNSVVTGRSEKLGEADKQGFAQQRVDKLEVSNNPLRDKTEVNLTDGSKVKLPDGVEDKDVGTIIKSDIEVIITSSKDNLKKADETRQLLDSASKTTSDAEELLNQLKGK